MCLDNQWILGRFAVFDETEASRLLRLFHVFASTSSQKPRYHNDFPPIPKNVVCAIYGR